MDALTREVLTDCITFLNTPNATQFCPNEWVEQGIYPLPLFETQSEAYVFLQQHHASLWKLLSQPRQIGRTDCPDLLDFLAVSHWMKKEVACRILETFKFSESCQQHPAPPALIDKVLTYLQRFHLFDLPYSMYRCAQAILPDFIEVLKTTPDLTGEEWVAEWVAHQVLSRSSDNIAQFVEHHLGACLSVLKDAQDMGESFEAPFTTVEIFKLTMSEVALALLALSPSTHPHQVLNIPQVISDVLARF